MYTDEHRWPFGSPRASGANEKERSAEIHTAGRFLYACQEVGLHVPDLLVEPQAVEIAQLRENGDGLLASHVTDRNAPSGDPRRR